MIRFLDLLHQYRWLRSRQELQIPLDPTEETRLTALERLLDGEGRRPRGDRRRMARIHCPLPVELTTSTGFGAGYIQDVGGDGMRIATSVSVGLGEELIVSVPDSEVGVEHVFPARVVWRRPGRTPELGLVFHGVPSQTVPPQRLERGPARRRRQTPMVA